MRETSPVLISRSSFGAAEVRRHGQRWFATLAEQAGADGIEVRGELLTAADTELQAMAESAAGVHRGYSSPEGLWSDAGDIERPALERGLRAAALLGASRLKMSIGGWVRSTAASLRAHRDRRADSRVEPVVENDQSAQAGALAVLSALFDAAGSPGLSTGMTFDSGNWHWTGECPLQAAGALSAQVRYVHCKGVPWAIEYPLAGDDLLARTRHQVALLRGVAGRAS